MTIKDIARECGCGLGTVSRALNNMPGVKEETRQRILAVVEKHGFVLNSHAKQLKAQDSRTIAIIIKGATSVLLTSMLCAIQKRLENLPYVASVIVIDETENEAQVAYKVYYEQKPIGFIFLGGNPDLHKEDFQKIQIPCVLISSEAENIENNSLSSVSTDNIKASEFSANYLIENGHKKIGVIGGFIEHTGTSTRRLKGFMNAMKNAGLAFDINKSYVPCKYSFDGGFEAVKVLMKNNPDITALWTMSDVMAIGAIRGLKDMGYSVPEQISVIGFDGLVFGDYYSPRLTTIKQQDIELAEKGLDLLLGRIEQREEASHILIPFKLIKGESVKNIN